ncbi:MAG: alpha/beta hydrolase [Actinobacteria bacterium]|nr:MAG: alpha/beta hydrolase [Actinomycetota bacterium]
MRAVRRRLIVVPVLVVLAACGGGAASGSKGSAAAGKSVSITVPVAPGSPQTIVLDAVERGRILPTLLDQGFHVLTFDFRGHGLSGGTRDPSRAAIDLKGAIAKIRSLGASRVLVVGASMGGTAAIVAAATEDLAGVVSISGPAQIDRLDAAAAMTKVREPKLFIVGRGDDARYTDGARSLFAAASQPKTIRVVDGTAAHGTDLLVDAKVGSQVRKLIVDFLIAHRG